MEREIEKFFDECLRTHDWEKAADRYEGLSEVQKSEKRMTVLGLLLIVAQTEAKMAKNPEKEGCLFFRKDCQDLDSLLALYYKIKYSLRRVEYDIEPCDGKGIIQAGISRTFLLMMLSLFTRDRKKVERILEECKE